MAVPMCVAQGVRSPRGSVLNPSCFSSYISSVPSGVSGFVVVTGTRRVSVEGVISKFRVVCLVSESIRLGSMEECKLGFV